MRRDIEALYREVKRNEDHAATINELLDTLHAGYINARGNPTLRKTLARKIEYHTRRLAALHAERDELRHKIMELRGGEETK